MTAEHELLTEIRDLLREIRDHMEKRTAYEFTITGAEPPQHGWHHCERDPNSSSASCRHCGRLLL